MDDPPKDIIIVQEDWDAKVDPGAHENWAGTVKRFGIDKTGFEFAISDRIILANNLHFHKPET